MVGENLKKIMTELGLTGEELARAADFDRTNISRIRNGKRIPSADGKTARRLVEGLCRLADDKGLTARLAGTVGAGGERDGNALRRKVTEFLFDGESGENGGRSAEKGRACRSFGERFNALTELSGFSNVQLSRLVNVDASLISRYRSGLRTPASNPALTGILCETLLRRINETGRQDSLSRLIGIPGEEADEEDLSRWLWEKRDDASAPIIEGLLEKVDLFSMPKPAPAPVSPTTAAADCDNVDPDVYFGTEGIRRAVTRFLNTAIREGGRELWLYSDEDMGWMVGDADFRRRWVSQMGACVGSGIRIKIIHNVDRDLREMTSAIVSWLPLYMSGMIESRYCFNKNGDRFSHTIFICPGVACVEGFNVRGAGTTGSYRWHTDDESLASFTEAYAKLREMSKPLVKIVSRRETSRGGDRISVCGRLSVGTLPEDIAAAGGDDFYVRWREERRDLERALRSGTVTECAGLRPADLPDVLNTPETFLAHRKEIAALTEKYPGFRFVPLDEPPFRNVDILIDGDGVSVTRRTFPAVTFRFTHPMMCRAFRGYAENIAQTRRRDRATVAAMLEGGDAG